MQYGIDVSNYTSPFASWTKDLSLVIVQAVDPPPSYPPGQTRDQIQACLDAGIAVDAYLWLWFDQDDIQSKLSLLDGLAIRTLWLDVEDSAARRYNQVDTEAIIKAALDKCDAYGTWLARPTGIYTGSWYWTSNLYLDNSTTFSDRMLWDANYDDQSDTAVFTPYGGWTSCAIKQFAGSVVVNGISGVDHNVLSDAEAALLVRPAP